MDLNYSQDESAFRDEVRGWIKQNLPQDLREKIANYDELGREDLLRWHKILAKKGWVAPAWPKEFGGTDWNVVQRYIFEEECGFAGTPPLIPFGLSMCGPVILRFGTPEQKKRFLPDIYNGDVFWCQGYSEPGSGSDLASLKTKAERQGDHYVVNGQKIWTTLGHIADWIFCLVRTDSTLSKRQEGISFLLIDMKTPGITVRPLILMDGGHEVNEVFFDNVKVPAENLIFEEGKGWTVAKYLLGHERMNTGRIGASKRELAKLKEFAAKQTGDDGQPLISDARFRDRLTRVEVELMALEITNLRFLDQMRRSGQPPGADVSMLKIKGTEIQQALTELSMQAVGPMAQPFKSVANDPDFDEFTAGLAPRYCNFRKTTIYAGSNEIQRNIISKMTLGTLTMNFDYNEEQQLLADSVRRFLAKDYAFEARKKIIASKEGWSPAVWAQLTEMGLMGLPFSPDYGGFGGGAVDLMGVMEAAGDALLVEPYLATVGLGAQFVARAGSEAQKKAILSAVVEGKLKLAFAHTEKGARYNLSKVGATAKKAGSGWEITGDKFVVLGAPAADTFVVSAKTDKGLSLFLVKKESAKVKPYITLDEQRAGDVSFSKAPGELLGTEGGALPVIEEVMDFATALICAEAVGAMKFACDTTLEYLKTRKQFGVPIGTFQALQHRMVDMYVSYEQAKSMACLAASKADSPTDAKDRARAISAAKIKIADNCRHVSQEAIQLHGGMGMTDEMKVSHTFKRLTMIAQQFGDAEHHLARFAKLS